MATLGTISWKYEGNTHYGYITEIVFRDVEDILFLPESI